MGFRRRAKSHPVFSQEFLIHNHADIGFFLVLCVLVALMFEVTAKTAFIFILPQYNISVPTAGSFYFLQGKERRWVTRSHLE